MRKTRCAKDGGRLTISFLDYPHASQVKDFYKLFKKASSHTVLGYQEDELAIHAVTDNRKNSIGFGWTEEHGCNILAKSGDERELARIAWEMLCYRYGDYRPYAPLLQGLVEGSDAADMKVDEPDQDILDDITELLALAV